MDEVFVHDQYHCEVFVHDQYHRCTVDDITIEVMQIILIKMYN